MSPWLGKVQLWGAGDGPLGEMWSWAMDRVGGALQRGWAGSVNPISTLALQYLQHNACATKKWLYRLRFLW